MLTYNCPSDILKDFFLVLFGLRCLIIIFNCIGLKKKHSLLELETLSSESKTWR